ncbi:MAG: precorrin-2 C(20)-methyltransferase [Euryarchaeota archaeon]|nr:precorrin-2 C(20)-methyltransferase [Euryarchaeota archaeon]
MSGPVLLHSPSTPPSGMGGPGRFYGVGIGPGDPDLITLRAIRVLGEVDIVVAPRSYPDRPSLALETLRRVLGKADVGEVMELVFPMTRDPAEREGHRDRNTEAIVAELRRGNTLAFITVGDPLLYSTYNYILRRITARHPDIPVETVPGISSVNHIVSLTNLPLAEGDEDLVMLPAWDPRLARTLDEHDNVMVMKIPKNPARVDELLSILARATRHRFYVSTDGRAWELPREKLDTLRKLEYMSLIFVKRDTGAIPPAPPADPRAARQAAP